MATLSVIYRIAADISGLQRDVERAAKSTQGLETLMGGVLASVTGAFSVGAIVGFAKEVVTLGSDLVDLSAKTGISVEHLQKLDAVASTAGSTLENVAHAITMMQKNLGDESSGAAGALKDLNINLATFHQLDSYNKFVAISTAARQMGNEEQRAADLAKLFGREWATLLPTLLEGFDAVTEKHVGMTTKAAKQLDWLSDHATLFWKQLKAGAGEAIGSTAQAVDNILFSLTKLTGQLAILGQGVKAPTLALPAPLKLPEEPNALDFYQMNKALEEQREKIRATDEATKKLTATNLRFRDSVQSIGSMWNRANWVGMPGDVHAVTAEVGTLDATLIGADDAVFAFANQEAYAAEQSAGLRKALAATHVEAKSFGDSLKDILRSVPQTLANAFTGGGGVMGAFKAIGSQLGSVVGSTIGKSIAMLGSFGGPIGAAIGSLAGPLISGLQYVFSGGAEHLINPVRQAFVDAAGGLDVLNEKAQKAGATLYWMLNAKNAQQYKKAIDDLNASLDFQAKAEQTLLDTIKKYGFTIEQLGPALARQQLDQQAQTLYQDFRVLTAAGLDTTVVLTKMADSINTFVHLAMQTGTEVPLAMQPMLQKMVDLGLLTDVAGNVITDLKDSGITFAESMSAGFSRVVSSVDKLTAAIARFLGITLDAANAVEHFPSFPDAGGGRGDRGLATGGFITAHGIQHFALGGNVLSFMPRGTDTVPAMLTPGELVLNRNQQAALFGGGGGVTHTHVYLDGREIATAVTRQQDSAFRLRRKLAAA